MTQFRLATWNINSVRLRIQRVMDFASRESPDVICLQEIKCQAAEFPEKAFRQAGYNHLAVSGQKGYHGVAIVSRIPLDLVDSPEFCQRSEARCQSVRVGGVELHNLYVPAGGDEPDPVLNDKFAHKLDFIDRMTKAYGERRGAGRDPLVVVGDINIAPEEHDVWSHKQLLKVVSHTPVETDGLRTLLAAGGLADVARHAHASDEKLYTWWSYRAKDWETSNRGRRLDHIWADEAALPRIDLSSYRIHSAERGGEKPSDHCPVTVTVRAG